MSLHPLKRILQWDKYPVRQADKFGVAMFMECGHTIHRKFSRAPILRARCEACPPLHRQEKLPLKSGQGSKNVVWCFNLMEAS